jgi:hypothetical protein
MLRSAFAREPEVSVRSAFAREPEVSVRSAFAREPEFSARELRRIKRGCGRNCWIFSRTESQKPRVRRFGPSILA